MGSPSSASLTDLRVFRDSKPASWLLCLGSRCCTTTMGGNSGLSPLNNSVSAVSPPAEAPMVTSSHHCDGLRVRFSLLGATTPTCRHCSLGQGNAEKKYEGPFAICHFGLVLFPRLLLRISRLFLLALRSRRASLRRSMDCLRKISACCLRSRAVPSSAWITSWSRPILC